MKDYIERASVHSIIERTSTFAFTRGGMHEKIDSLPTAGVAEVQHGRWSPVAFGIGICTTKYRCSICKQYENVDREYKYCPNCGARMDKEADHD